MPRFGHFLAAPLRFSPRLFAPLLIAALLVAGLLATGPARAQSAPDAIVAEIYTAYDGTTPVLVSPSDPEMREMFSERLRPLLEKDFERAESDGIGLLDFDVFVDGQDFDLTGLEIAKPQVSGDTAVVEAHFMNFGEPRRIVYGFVREGGAWRIDEISAPEAPYPWTLSEILSQ